MSVTKQNLIDKFTSGLSGYSDTQDLTTVLDTATDKAIKSVDDYTYTVNPNSTYHPATVRR